MSTAEKLETTEDFKVADISLAAYGRRELDIAEGEMPALMAMASSSPPKIWMPTGLSSSKISSFCLLFMASLINPSLLMNSVYIRSAPCFLHTARKGGSLTSSMGASKSGNPDKFMLPIFIIQLLQSYK